MKRFLRTAVLSTAAALLMFTCKAPDLFSEYDEESFLSSTSLQSDSWLLMPDYTFETGTTAADYMDYSLVSSSGGPNGGPVYRLEIKNLLKNGDFETGATTAPWFLYDAGTKTGAPGDNDIASTLEIINSGSYSIANNTVQINLTTDERAKIVYTDAFANNSTYVPNKSYFFKYDYRTGSPLNIFYIPQWTSLTVEPDLYDFYYFQSFGGVGGSSDNQSITNLNTYPPLDPSISDPRTPNRTTASSYSVALNTDSLTFAGSAQGGSFDNFRIVRSPEGEFDLKLRLKMNIDHNPEIDIIPGFYKFSVWVKQENVSTMANVFNADRVELGIQAYDTENKQNVSDYKIFYMTQALSNLYSLETDGGFSGDWRDGWVELVLASQFTFQVPDISADPVMELTISPSNPGIKDNSWNRLTAGSILIADPRLEYSPTSW